MEVKFVKVGNDFINAELLERFLIIDDEVYLSTISGSERTLISDPDEDGEKAMKRVVRRISEKAHDIIYLDAFANQDEDMLSSDQASNLLYRKWLEQQEKHNP